MAGDGEPDVTATPSTVTDAPAAVVVGVTVTDATAFVTEAVYDVVPAANEGANDTAPPVPVTTKSDRVASADGTLYTRVAAGELPIRFVATTLNVYEAPFVRPDAVQYVAVLDGGVQVTGAAPAEPVTVTE